MGRIIEQPALRVSGIRSMIGEIGVNGHRIRKRRKNEVIHGERGVSGGVPIEFAYEARDGAYSRILRTYGNKPPRWEIENAKEFRVITVAEERTKQDEMASVSFVEKLILGSGMKIWGERFGRSSYAKKLRTDMWNQNLDECSSEVVPPDQNHLSIEDDDGKLLNDIDTFNNFPDTTIAIFKERNMVFGLVNILGGVESMCSLGDFDEETNLFENVGIVIIISSTKNTRRTYIFSDYGEFKMTEYRDKKNQ